MEDPPLYEPLPQDSNSRCIRVLDVQAATTPHVLDEKIRAELRIVKLDAELPPRFSALSYVWGRPGTEPCSVLCGAHSVPILSNGHSALKYLRKKLGKFTIWIDAICINQEDEKEKEIQIPLMGEVYSRSEFVYVWLGSGDADTQRAIAYLRKPRFLKYLYSRGSIESGILDPSPWRAMLAYEWERSKIRTSLFPSSKSRENIICNLLSKQ